MWIICQQMIHMKFQAWFFLKLRKISQSLLFATVVIGILRVKTSITIESS